MIELLAGVHLERPRPEAGTCLVAAIDVSASVQRAGAERAREVLEVLVPRLGPDDLVVVLLPDGGRGYLGKIFDDEWMRSYGFGPAVEGTTVADLLAAKHAAIGGDASDLLAVRPEDDVADAIGVMRRYGVSQLLVLSAEQPVVMGKVVGTVDERGLVDHAFSSGGDLRDPVGPPRGRRFVRWVPLPPVSALVLQHPGGFGNPACCAATATRPCRP